VKAEATERACLHLQQLANADGFSQLFRAPPPKHIAAGSFRTGANTSAPGFAQMLFDARLATGVFLLGTENSL